ncbi:MAG TPA: Gfo/Idh/MocA family oxidoreductase [Chthonomonadales bacterium]|nr:Gfo/Idh/MocA family oxidoreductase [Chthonomonadales bacterium]
MDLGIGIVGYGFIGKVHTFAHRALPLLYDPMPARTRLVGVCTASEASGRKAIEQAGFEVAVRDHRALLERDDIHAIHCCTPNDAHRDLLLDALRAGKHVYCDKPLTRTVDEAEEVAALARSTCCVHRMTFHYRFVPAILRARQLVDDDFLGQVYHFRAAYLHAGYLDPRRPATWRLRYDRSGGGAIMDLGVHAIDLMRFLLGDFAEVRAEMRTFIEERPDPMTRYPVCVDVDDVALIQARMACGALGSIEASRLATGAQDELRFDLHGSRGAISFNLMDPNWLTVYDNRDPEAPLGGSRGQQRLECVARYPKPYAIGATKSSVGWLQFHAHCLYDFVESVAAGELRRPSFEDGLAAQRVVAACERSSRTGQWEAVSG